MTEKTTVIYNDTCPICSREVDAYRATSQKHGLEIAYQGLSVANLDTFGLTAEQSARRFHVLKDGVLLDGVPAFAALWGELPRLRWLAWLVTRPVLRTVLAVVYDHVLAPMLYAMHVRRQRRRGVDVS